MRGCLHRKPPEGVLDEKVDEQEAGSRAEEGRELWVGDNGPARGGGCLNRSSQRFDRVLEDPGNSLHHNNIGGGEQKGKGEWRKERSGSPPPASIVALRGLATGPLFLLSARVECGSGLALWLIAPGPVWIFLGGGVGVKRGGY